MDITKSGSLLVKFLVTILFVVGLVACETIGYYGQAARGQLTILWNREHISDLLADQDLPAELRQKLSTVLAIRQFATEDLLLPAGDSYLSYVELNRQHVVWNVFAAPEFSVDPVNWCYPVAGCVSYRGYFSEAGASNFARRLQQQGYDVYTGGVDAYSTLGWFDDPILSTVINRQDYQLASLIFHELAHQLVYVPGDTTFNESFATAVEQEGLRRWLDQQGDGGSLESARQESMRRQQFVELVIDFRERFATLYRQRVAPSLMRERKNALQEEMRTAYQELKAGWGGIGAYDRWFSSSLNNAQLSTVSSYNELVPALARLLQNQGGDLAAFYTRVGELADLSQEDRESRLQVGNGQ
jgi:predicted aminopeptidase